MVLVPQHSFFLPVLCRKSVKPCQIMCRVSVFLEELLHTAQTKCRIIEKNNTLCVLFLKKAVLYTISENKERLGLV